MRFLHTERALPISIHSPLAGRDQQQGGHMALNDNFNPLSPRGERREGDNQLTIAGVFQSTLPSRGETAYYTRQSVAVLDISIQFLMSALHFFHLITLFTSRFYPNSSANPLKKYAIFRFALHNQHIIRPISRLSPNVFDFILRFIPKHIKPQAIFLRINQSHQFMTKYFELRSIQYAFKYRILYPLSMCNAGFRHLPQPTSSSGI